jgi:hypothetical protein
MASSVSSEQAFSQGGITISKHRNCLKGDIVEALQCIKCALRHDLLFCEPGPSSLVEDELDKYETEAEVDETPEDDEDKEEGWEALCLDDDESDIEIDRP